MTSRVSDHIRRNIYGLIAIFIALGGVSWAATTAPRNSVVSKSIKNGEVKNVDLGVDAVDSSKVLDGSLTGADLENNTVTGTQVDESTFGIVPNADKLDNIDSTGFIQNGTAAQTAGFHVTQNSRVAGSCGKEARRERRLFPTCFPLPTPARSRGGSTTTLVIQGASLHGQTYFDGARRHCWWPPHRVERRPW